MMRRLAAALLRLFGWRVSVTAPDYPKCLICVAPHTSNWDFVLGKLAYASVGRRAGFLMKETWFFFPLGAFFRAIGGVPVARGRKGDLVQTLVQRFDNAQTLHIAITPEGTRSRVDRWHTGFLRIAYAAKDVKILLGAFDFPTRTITVDKVFTPTGDIDDDINAVKQYYAPFTGRYPDKFSVKPQTSEK